MSVDQIFFEARAKGASYGPIYYDDNLIQHMTMGISEPGVGKGVLLAQVDLSMIDVLISQLSLTDSGWAYVVDSNGFIVSHPVQGYATEHMDVS